VGTNKGIPYVVLRYVTMVPACIYGSVSCINVCR